MHGQQNIKICHNLYWNFCLDILITFFLRSFPLLKVLQFQLVVQSYPLHFMHCCSNNAQNHLKYKDRFLEGSIYP